MMMNKEIEKEKINEEPRERVCSALTFRSSWTMRLSLYLWLNAPIFRFLYSDNDTAYTQQCSIWWIHIWFICTLTFYMMDFILFNIKLILLIIAI